MKKSHSLHCELGRDKSDDWWFVCTCGVVSDWLEVSQHGTHAPLVAIVFQIRICVSKRTQNNMTTPITDRNCTRKFGQNLKWNERRENWLDKVGVAFVDTVVGEVHELILDTFGRLVKFLRSKSKHNIEHPLNMKPCRVYHPNDYLLRRRPIPQFCFWQNW